MGPEYIEASRAGLACSGSGRKPLDAVEERDIFRSKHFHKVTLASMIRETQGEQQWDLED